MRPTTHSRPSTRWGRLTSRLAVGLLAACAALALTATSAQAHPLSTTAVLLDVGPERVTGHVQLPIDRLAIAVDQPLTASTVAEPAKLDELRRYVTAHLSATDTVGGAVWTTSVTGGTIEAIDGVDHLVVDIALTPPEPTVRAFDLHYDAIVERLVSHRVFVSSRTAGTDAFTALGIIDWQTQTVGVPAEPVAGEPGFVGAVRLGMQHIAEGADHLLFLLMLLLPAPLLARRGRWERADDIGRQIRRTVHVVTAFAVGHSVTLALAALGCVSLPTRIVESLIAVSILVSAAHAVRPIVRGGEVGIAGGFGLMHGLAFASLLAEMNLGPTMLAITLLGFNVGIELAQLVVLALVMPSLLVLSRTGLYPAVRLALGGLGIVLAVGWLAERTTLISADPFDGFSNTLVEHPFTVPATLAVVAAAAVVKRRRTAEAPESASR